MSYMTRQQQAVLQCIEASPDGRATAMELMQRLRQSGQTVGLSTVYRQLERLVAQGCVHKLLTDDGACYQYCDKTRHKDCFLLQCEGCGAIFHMDCSHLGELYTHLLESHGFRVDIKNDSMFAVAEAYNAEETLRRTRLIGYLLIHSRQVDMIMKDTVRAAALKEKLAGDMATLMAKPLQFS